MKLLQIALIFNSLFSLATGTLLAAQSEKMAQLFGIQLSLPFTVLGFGLITFSIAVYIISRQNPVRPLLVLIIIVLDFIWVLASFILLITNPFEITQTGNILAGAVAFIVFTIALIQSIGLSKIDTNSKTGFKQLRFERIVDADSQQVWNMISDVAHYHHVAPNIDEVEIISGNKQGMIRRCSQGKYNWTENCIHWNDGEQFSFRVNTNEPDYPFPLSFLQGTWKVLPLRESKSKIEMVFEFQYKKKLFNILLHPLMGQKFRSIAEELLDTWESKLTPGRAHGD